MTNLQIIKIQQALAKIIEGSILDPDDLGYANSIKIDNNRVTRHPYLVALPANTNDVSTIIKYCADHKIKITVKSGGHSATGYCLNSEGIVLDMLNLNTITLLDDGRQLNVGSGVRWIQAYNYLNDQQSDYTVIGGGCAGVGVAGFVLGGGYSFISRSYGLGCDNVTAMEFVSAKGEIIELNDKSTGDNAELFWALKGSGGGNFGIITRIDLKLQKTNQPRLMMGQVTFPFYRLKEILKFYNDWAPTLPNEMAMYGMLRNFPDPRHGGAPTLKLRFTPVFNGTMAEGIEHLKPLTALGPDSVEVYNMNLPEWENFIGTATEIQGHSAYIRSSILTAGSLTDDVAAIFQKFMSRAPSPDSYVVWTHTGGKVSQLGDNGSSYAHRDAEYTFELKSVWNSAQPQSARPNIEWAVNFYDELGKHSQGSYINYIDPLLLDWKERYYRGNIARLLKVKQQWDAGGQFNFQQGVDSDYVSQRSTPLDLSPLNRTYQ